MVAVWFKGFLQRLVIPEIGAIARLLVNHPSAARLPLRQETAGGYQRQPSSAGVKRASKANSGYWHVVCSARRIDLEIMTAADLSLRNRKHGGRMSTVATGGAVDLLLRRIPSAPAALAVASQSEGLALPSVQRFGEVSIEVRH